MARSSMACSLPLGFLFSSAFARLTRCCRRRCEMAISLSWIVLPIPFSVLLCPPDLFPCLRDLSLELAHRLVFPVELRVALANVVCSFVFCPLSFFRFLSTLWNSGVANFSLIFQSPSLPSLTPFRFFWKNLTPCHFRNKSPAAGCAVFFVAWWCVVGFPFRFPPVFALRLKTE